MAHESFIKSYEKGLTVESVKRRESVRHGRFIAAHKILLEVITLPVQQQAGGAIHAERRG